MTIAETLCQELLLSRKEALRPVVRWTVRKKARLLLAVAEGVVTQSEVMEAHGIDEAEWSNWTRGVETFGRDGLRAMNNECLMRGAP